MPIQPVTAPAKLRCAIYTRKSTEEGLDQAFNSLDAQREACEAFVVSQASLGWKLVPAYYDDGGISGGTMERPALQRLLEDIRSDLVDIVVVYKIDRLTRSLADFAKMVEIFDAATASFVSVTQQFNTTTSMGRLTLNVLLSFAQFEREVTAERIRDKVAASRAKGIFMGGSVPLGYRVVDRRLVIDEKEASAVRFLFRRYLELGSLDLLAAEANAMKIPSQRKNSDGTTGARTFTRGPLSYLLANPVYIGKVRHKTTLHDGEHQPIIEPKLFDDVQKMLQGRAARRSAKSNTPGMHLLTGLVHDEQGRQLLAVHSSRKQFRYRYYATYRGRTPEGAERGREWRLASHELERPVERELQRLLTDRKRLADLLGTCTGRDAASPNAAPIPNVLDLADRARDLVARYQSAEIPRKREILKTLIARIELRPGQMAITIRIDGLANALGLMIRQDDRETATDGSVSSSPKPHDLHHTIILPMTIRRRGLEMRIVIDNGQSDRRTPDPALVALLRRAQTFREQMLSDGGGSVSELASRNSVDRSDFARILKLAFLAPEITESILAGSQPVELTAYRLMRLPELPHRWSDQRSLLGF